MRLMLVYELPILSLARLAKSCISNKKNKAAQCAALFFFDLLWAKRESNSHDIAVVRF